MIVNEPERRGRLFFFIWTGILLVGIAVMLYPKVGKIWNAGRQSRVVDGYERSVEKLDARKEEEMIAQTRAYNVMLLEQNNPVPNDKNADSYGALLNMTSDGVMGYLEISEIRVKLPIYHGTGDFAICNGAGHVEGSSFPIGGKGTHAVLSSHRGLPGAKLFSDLDKLKVGDYFTITVLRQTIFYQIDRIDIVEPEETGLLALDKEKDYCTLLTCTPYGINTKRLLVRGVRCDRTESVCGRRDLVLEKEEKKKRININRGIKMQTVFAEKTEDRSLDDNRHIGELFFIRMYWEKGRIPSGNILYWKDAKREDAQINFTGFDGLLLYLDETCEQNGVLLRKAQVRRNQKRRRYLEAGKELELVKKSEHAAVFWLKVMGREFASFQGIVHIWGRDYPYRSGFELIILLKDIVGFTERRSVRKNWKAERN